MDNQLRVVVFQEDGVWVAQCIEYDIGTQAPDFKTLVRRFDLTMKVEIEESLRRHNKAFGGIPPAPEYLKKMWAEGTPIQLQEQPRSERPTPSTAPATYELALCA